jgi:hypothetical protein
MASLASYTTLYVIAVRVDGGVSLKNIAAVRWDAGDRGPEESSVGDFIGWLDRGDARAFVRRVDGDRGPRIRVDEDGGGGTCAAVPTRRARPMAGGRTRCCCYHGGRTARRPGDT